MNIDDVIRELECFYVQGYPEYWDYHEKAVEILKAVKKFMGKFENKTCTNFGRTEFMSEELYNTVSELFKGEE